MKSLLAWSCLFSVSLGLVSGQGFPGGFSGYPGSGQEGGHLQQQAQHGGDDISGLNFGGGGDQEAFAAAASSFGGAGGPDFGGAEGYGGGQFGGHDFDASGSSHVPSHALPDHHFQHHV